MGGKRNHDDPIAQRLSEILTAVQNMLIIQAAGAGIGKAEVRKIVGVADSRVSSIWRHLKKES